MILTISPSQIPILLVLLLIVTGCDTGCKQSLNRLVDTDQDGWLDSMSNKRITLHIDAVDFHRQSQFELYDLIVDDIIIAEGVPAVGPINNITSRTEGIWGIGQRWGFKAPIRISKNNMAQGELEFFNNDSTFDKNITIGDRTISIRYHTEVSFFSDPDPTDTFADRDLDGILDIEEADLARTGRKLGDPSSRDLLVITTFTAPKWKIEPASVCGITTAFNRRNIHCLIVDESSDLIGTTPGTFLPLDPNGNLVILQEQHGVSLSQVSPVRLRHMEALYSPYAHLMVFADHTPDADFGIANLPGLNLVMRSHFFLLGPSPVGKAYQAITAMHELGHNLNLCHPNEDPCPSGVLPDEEQNGAASCMGSPADDGGLFNGILPNLEAISNALSRPLDYSQTQWTNANLASGRTEDE